MGGLVAGWDRLWTKPQVRVWQFSFCETQSFPQLTVDCTPQVVPDQDGANLDGPDLDVLLLNTVMDNIRSMSAGVQKTMLKSIITSLLDHSKPLYRSDTLISQASALSKFYIPQEGQCPGPVDPSPKPGVLGPVDLHGVCPRAAEHDHHGQW